MAINGWISILDNHKAVLDARKEAQGLKDQETEESDNWRNNQLRLLTDHNEPAQIARKRKASQPSQLARQVSVATDLSSQVSQADNNFAFDDEDDDGDPFADHPFIIDQSTPVDSIAASPAGTHTPTPGPERRRTRLRTNTS